MPKCSIPEFHGKAILLKHIHFVSHLLFLKLTIISCNSIWNTFHVTGNSWIFPESINRIFFQGRLHLISMENQFSLFGFCTKLKFSIEKLSMQTFPEHQRMSMPCSWSHSSKVVPKILLRFYKLATLIHCHSNNNAFPGSGSSSKFSSWIWKQNIVFHKIIKTKWNPRFRRNYIPRKNYM